MAFKDLKKKKVEEKVNPNARKAAEPAKDAPKGKDAGKPADKGKKGKK